MTEKENRMCYDDKAQVPTPPGAINPATGSETELTASDGNRFMAYLALPSTPATAQLLILPDIRGLHQFYKDLALRFAEVGVATVAMDYFGRTAGISARDESFEFWPHVQQLTRHGVFADARASLDYLQTQSSAPAKQFTVGFCMGGTFAFLSGAQNLGLDGVIGFYAGLSRAMGGGGTLLEDAHEINTPSLGLFGGADQGIPVEQVKEFEGILAMSGVSHEIIIYPDAPHSFFDRRYEEFAVDSADAWTRMLGFIAKINQAA
jgi:carboxymethylenebutenolidase